MSHPGRVNLRVQSVGGRHFIEVPSGESQALSNYLREHRVRSGGPEPSSTGVDNIELHRTTDAEAVQNLLDQWA
jgi:hypothetical protein